MKWLTHWQERKKQARFNRGYDYAAGALLRGEETPGSLEAKWWHNPYSDEFDTGVMTATKRLINLNVIEDNSI